MWRIILSILVFVCVMLSLGLAPQAPSTSPATEMVSGSVKLRVGVYDNRGIALAWFHSKYNDLAEMRIEYEQAKQAGDDERIKELEALGPKLQRRLHFQGFGRAPVTKLLAQVKDKLPALAKEVSVDVIAFECNYLGPDVEKVDITLELVALFDPSPETIKMIKFAMENDPIALEELTDDDH